jgi:hypothetical protein
VLGAPAARSSSIGCRSLVENYFFSDAIGANQLFMTVISHGKLAVNNCGFFPARAVFEYSGLGIPFMRALSIIYCEIREVFEPQRILRWAEVGATIVATTTAVLLASFVAIAMGLI